MASDISKTGQENAAMLRAQADELSKQMDKMQNLADTFFNENGGYVESDTNAPVMPDSHEDVWHTYCECVEILWVRIKELRAEAARLEDVLQPQGNCECKAIDMTKIGPAVRHWLRVLAAGGSITSGTWRSPWSGRMLRSGPYYVHPDGNMIREPMADKLENAGLVTWEYDQAKRGFTAKLTAAGRQIAEKRIDSKDEGE